MSTILNALRRLEADEQRKAEAQRVSGNETPPSAGRAWRGPRLWVLAGVVLLAGAGIGMGLRELSDEDLRPAPVGSQVPLAEPTPSPSVTEAIPVAGSAFVEETKDPSEGPRVISRRPEPSAPPEREVEPARPQQAIRPSIESEGTADAIQIPVVVRQARPDEILEISPKTRPSSTFEGRTRGVSELTRMASPADSGEMDVEITSIAEGPIRVVSELPVATPPPPTQPKLQAAASEIPSAESVPAKATSPSPPPLPVETPPEKAVASTPSPARSVEKGPEVPAPVASSSQPEPPPVALAAESAPVAEPPLLTVAVLRTVWHPEPERRSANLSADGRPAQVSFEVGDLWQGWRLVEIKLSGVVFERDGVRRERRVGQSP
ncbi:MAG: hypothetical protein VCC04_14310 [Myxococcota bacterium]